MSLDDVGQVSADEGPLIVSLDEERGTDLALTGGKGANLTRLTMADFPVPPGFCVTTAASRLLVDDPAIRTAIESLETLDPGDSAAIAEQSGAIRSAIRDRTLPTAVRRSVESALDSVDAGSYAVRSSATAEDLPTASFAGMHETFLGVGPDAVPDRIRDCVASLFTDRAVAYRLRNDVVHAEVGMAVVVQAMVDPDVAGVLFTADPVSGNRHVASVDANYGLGDTVVTGDVSPDNARVDRRTGEVIEYDVGDKRRALRSIPGIEGGDASGTEIVDLDPARRDSRALTEDQLRDLVALGDRVEDLLGAPQDVEWALVDGEFHVLQSRPITSLFPIPTPEPADEKLHVYVSFGHLQAMPAPLPPLVVDWWRETLNRTIDRFLTGTPESSYAVEAGHRMYVDLTGLLGIGAFRRAVPAILGATNEPAAAGLATVLDRPDAVTRRGRIDGLLTVVRGFASAGPSIASVPPRIVARLVRSLLLGPPDPGDIRALAEWTGTRVADRIAEPADRRTRVERAFETFDLAAFMATVGPRFFPVMLGVVVSGRALERLFPDAEADREAIGKGFEEELVTHMNQRLGDLADLARAHPEVERAIADGASLTAIEAAGGGEAFAAAFEDFRREFGHRGTSEIDLSRPRWRDDPGTLLGTIRSDLAGSDRGEHREHLDRLEREADAAADRLVARAGGGIFGPVRKRVVRRLVAVYQSGIQCREYPKHGVSHAFAAVHDALRETGASLAAEGRLAHADDVWFLRRDELIAALEGDGAIDVAIERRRRDHERFQETTAPPLITSEGETPTGSGAVDAGENVLTGTPVSAGVVEGTARVVRDPSTESLAKGEILVAPSTDPGWTPLFLNAAGLVMEVGGRMTHGALVAREYGIPGVASVGDATTEIRTGERIRIDGERGTVELIDR